MPKKPTEIKSIHAVRLKSLLREQNIKQNQLSEMLKKNYSTLSQQTLSKIITGKAPLTTERAYDIIALFPFYRIEWLLGDADDAFRFQNSDIKFEKDMLNVGAYSLVKSLGYDIVPAVPMRDDIDSIDDESARAKAYMESFTESFNAGYILIGNGNKCHLSVFQLRELKEHIQRIVKYSLQEYIEKADA